MKADMMKNTHGLNRWVVSRFLFFVLSTADDILRFADYIPVVLSHSIHARFSLLSHSPKPFARAEGVRTHIMAQYTHQKHSCMAFAFGIIKIDISTSSPRAHLHLRSPSH